MDDAGAGGHCAEVAEGFLCPAEKGVAFAVALELEEHVEIEGIFCAVVVYLYGVVDDEVNWDERVGQCWICSHLEEGVAHGCEVDYAGYAGEVLEEHTRGAVVDFLRGCLEIPLGDVFDVGLFDGEVVFKSKEVFDQDADGYGDPLHVEAGFCECG